MCLVNTKGGEISNPWPVLTVRREKASLGPRSPTWHSHGSGAACSSPTFLTGLLSLALEESVCPQGSLAPSALPSKAPSLGGRDIQNKQHRESGGKWCEHVSWKLWEEAVATQWMSPALTSLGTQTFLPLTPNYMEHLVRTEDCLMCFQRNHCFLHISHLLHSPPGCQLKRVSVQILYSLLLQLLAPSPQSWHSALLRLDYGVNVSAKIHVLEI